MQQTEIDGAGVTEAAETAVEASPEAAPKKPRHRSAEHMRRMRATRTPRGPEPVPPADRAPLPSEDGPAEEDDDADPMPFFMNGIRIPAGTTTYRVARYEDGRNKKVKDWCTLTPPGATEAIQNFPIDQEQGKGPNWSTVLTMWGSGFYAFLWCKPNNSWGGFSQRKRLDDAQFPPMPSHRSLQAVPVPVAPAAAPPAVVLEPMTAIVQSLAATGGGKIDASVAIALIMMGNQANAQIVSALEERQRRWRIEDEDRAAAREREAEARLARERAMAEDDRRRIETFYTSARKADRADSEDERMRRLEDRLDDALDALEDRDDGPATAPKSVTDQAIEAMLPIVAARLGTAMAPPSAPDDGKKS